MSNARPDGPNTASEHPLGTGYDEDTFLYFMAVERARAERSNHPLRLLFATLEAVPGTPAPIPSASASKLFRGLRMSLRETDVLGWYRQGCVAGAVLSERADRYRSDLSGAIQERVGEVLRRQLPSEVARRLRVRVVQLGPQPLESA